MGRTYTYDLQCLTNSCYLCHLTEPLLLKLIRVEKFSLLECYLQSASCRVGFEGFKYRNNEYIIKEISVCGDFLDTIQFLPFIRREKITHLRNLKFSWNRLVKRILQYQLVFLELAGTIYWGKVLGIRFPKASTAEILSQPSCLQFGRLVLSTRYRNSYRTQNLPCALHADY